MEVVHVELAYEAVDVVMLEVSGEHAVGEYFAVYNRERGSVVSPSHDILVQVLFKNAKEYFEEIRDVFAFAAFFSAENQRLVRLSLWKHIGSRFFFARLLNFLLFYILLGH